MDQEEQVNLQKGRALPVIHQRSPSRLIIAGQLLRILLRSFLRYPLTCIRSLKFTFGTKVFPCIKRYTPSSSRWQEVFDRVLQPSWPPEGSFTLPNEESWDDYIVFAHNVGLKIADAAGQPNAWPLVTKVRWGIAHGLYNAIVHGAPGEPIEVRWRQTPNELELDVVNTGDKTRQKPHPVSYHGIPISGVGGSMVLMNLLFDEFELARRNGGAGKNQVRLYLLHRFNAQGDNIFRQAALHIAASRDKIQMERIIRGDNMKGPSPNQMSPNQI